MKLGQLKSTLLIIIFSFLLFNNTFSKDLLDSVKSNSKLVIELKDCYRAFHVNNIIIDQKEMINVLLKDGSEEDIKTFLDSCIKACDSLKIIHFNNETLNSFVSKYLSLTRQNYKTLQEKGIGSSEFKKDFENYKQEKGKYMDYLSSTYSTNHFISLTKETYWKTNDKKNYIKSSDYSTYTSLKTTHLKDALILLDKISNQTTDFQEYSIYQIELADQHVKHRDSLEVDASEKAIGIYKAILDQDKYSIYLFESWLKWRTVTQQNNGLSKTSHIPNDQYDKVREQVALTILDYITKNDKDEMAINEFLLMATHNTILRFGAYPYGNQNTVEYHEIFDEKK